MPVAPNAWCSTLRKALFAVMLVLMALAFTIFRPPPTPGPFERDLEAYYAAGATYNAGLDPYSRAIWNVERAIGGVVSTRDELLPFIGPPASLALWSPLARMPFVIAQRVWLTIGVTALCVIVFASLALARAPRELLARLVAITLVLATGPMLSDLGLGQVAAVAVAAIAIALVAYDRGWTFAAIGATLVAVIQPNLGVVLAARMRSRRDLAFALTAAAAFVALTLLAVAGRGDIGSYLQRLAAHGAAERFVLIQETPAAIAFGFGLSPAFASALGVAAALAALAVTALVIVRAKLDPRDGALVAIAALPLVMPFFHEHDFVIVILPAIVLAFRTRGGVRALAAVATVLALVDWLGFAQRPLQNMQNACLAIVVALGFAAIANVPRREVWYGLAGLGALTVVLPLAILAANAHPAPVWPDTLPTNFTAPLDADASAVWASEQRAAGLTARDPVWSLLRLGPLIGCVLLGYALIRSARPTRA
jgi:hypothetical protein